MDFDDLLLNCLTLLSDHPSVQTYYSQKFHHILVDEYQDTNRIQADMIDLLSREHGNIMVVGDDSQSIYSFRGAHFANILEFPKRYPGAHLYKLETNYRSTPEILGLANPSIINNQHQFHKKLKATRGTGAHPILVPCNDVLQQAGFVAQRMLELQDEGRSLNEMAVLYRAHYHSMELQMELTRRGIPFEIRSGLRFFEQAHIKDITSYLKVLVNPVDELAWKRIAKLLSALQGRTEGVSEMEWGKVSDRAIAAHLELLRHSCPTVTNMPQKQAEGASCRIDLTNCSGKIIVPVRSNLHPGIQLALAEPGAVGRNGLEVFLAACGCPRRNQMYAF